MSQPTGGPATCASCGAPDDGELVICRFCARAVSASAQQSAIPCPNQQCRTLCRWGKQNCTKCKAWLVVSCVFCGGISPHSVASCLSCNEAFAGAPQRKMQIEQQRQHRQNMQSAQVFGDLALGAAGIFGGVAIASAFDHHDTGSIFDSFDGSSTSDDFDGDMSGGAFGSSDDD